MRGCSLRHVRDAAHTHPLRAHLSQWARSTLNSLTQAAPKRKPSPRIFPSGLASGTRGTRPPLRGARWVCMAVPWAKTVLPTPGHSRPVTTVTGTESAAACLSADVHGHPRNQGQRAPDPSCHGGGCLGQESVRVPSCAWNHGPPPDPSLACALSWHPRSQVPSAPASVRTATLPSSQPRNS